MHHGLSADGSRNCQSAPLLTAEVNPLFLAFAENCSAKCAKNIELQESVETSLDVLFTGNRIDIPDAVTMAQSVSVKSFIHNPEKYRKSSRGCTLQYVLR